MNKCRMSVNFIHQECIGSWKVDITKDYECIFFFTRRPGMCLKIRAENTQSGLTGESAHLAILKGWLPSELHVHQAAEHKVGLKLSCKPQTVSTSPNQSPSLSVCVVRCSRWSMVCLFSLSMLIQARRGSRGWDLLCVAPLPWWRGQH